MQTMQCKQMMQTSATMLLFENPFLYTVGVKVIFRPLPYKCQWALESAFSNKTCMHELPIF